MKKRVERVVISVSFPLNLKREIEKVKGDLTFSFFINQAVKFYLNFLKETKNDKKID